MTIIDSMTTLVDPEYRIPAVDLYRDIHKGIRAELFAVTSTAGSIDPSDRCDRAALADHITSVAAVLESHAHHEDSIIDPVLERHLPELANEITTDHERLEAMFASVTDLAGATIDARGHRPATVAPAPPPRPRPIHQLVPRTHRPRGARRDAMASTTDRHRRDRRDARRDRRLDPARRDGPEPGVHAAGDEHRRPHRAVHRHASGRTARGVRRHDRPGSIGVATDRLRRHSPIAWRWHDEAHHLALFLCAPLLFAACGDDADATADDDASTGVLDVTLSDFSFGELPDEVAAGTRVRVDNTSESELHELVAVRLPDGDDRSVDEIVASGLDEVFSAGPPAAVLLAAPGGQQIDAVGDGVLAEPGRYLLLCTIPTGADPQEYLERPPPATAHRRSTAGRRTSSTAWSTNSS